MYGWKNIEISYYCIEKISQISNFIVYKKFRYRTEIFDIDIDINFKTFWYRHWYIILKKFDIDNNIYF